MQFSVLPTLLHSCFMRLTIYVTIETVVVRWVMLNRIREVPVSNLFSENAYYETFPQPLHEYTNI